MKSPLLLLSIPLLLACLSAAPQTTEGTLPGEARRGRAAHDKAVADARQAYDAALASARAEYLKALTAARADAGKRNRLGEMNAIQTEVDRLATAPDAGAGARVKIAADDVAGKRFFFMLPQRNEPLRLAVGGRIENAVNRNETYWRVRGDSLEFVDEDGSTVTSAYTILTALDGQLILSGHSTIEGEKNANGGRAPAGLVMAAE